MMPERPHSEDVLIYKGGVSTRKTRLSVEEEFLHDMQSMIYLDAIKRRRLENHSKILEDTAMHVDNNNNHDDDYQMGENQQE